MPPRAPLGAGLAGLGGAGGRGDGEARRPSAPAASAPPPTPPAAPARPAAAPSDRRLCIYPRCLDATVSGRDGRLIPLAEAVEAPTLPEMAAAAAALGWRRATGDGPAAAGGGGAEGHQLGLRDVRATHVDEKAEQRGVLQRRVVARLQRRHVAWVKRAK